MENVSVGRRAAPVSSCPCSESPTLLDAHNDEGDHGADKEKSHNGHAAI